MTYLLCRNGNYYYNRQVPTIYRDLDPRDKVRIALNTDSKRDAWRKAVVLNDQIEAYWKSLVPADQRHNEARFGKIVHIARQFGFSYLPMSAVINLPPDQLCSRVVALKGAEVQQIDAALGITEEPTFSLTAALEKYWELARHKTIDKSPDQVRKWRNPRIKAVANFVKLVGDLDLTAITRSDILALRDWWIDRIENEELKPSSANKDFVHIKDVLKTTSKHFKLELDIVHLFEELMFEEDNEQTRLPFSSDEIVAILANKKFNEMDEDVRWLFTAMADTGARNTEIIGLLPEDISVNAAIPHIAIVARKGHKLKTKHSRRVIPLVGYSLDAFITSPKGCPKYRDYPDRLTTKANKLLRENELFPSDKHSLYSLRHSFQDRLTHVNAGERVQTDLMGHKFSREKYGHGASLEDKKNWLDKICLKESRS